MDERLMLAAQFLIALLRERRYETPGKAARDALAYADALIAAEKETRK